MPVKAWDKEGTSRRGKQGKEGDKFHKQGQAGAAMDKDETNEAREGRDKWGQDRNNERMMRGWRMQRQVETKLDRQGQAGNTK